MKLEHFVFFNPYPAHPKPKLISFCFCAFGSILVAKATLSFDVGRIRVKKQIQKTEVNKIIK